MDFPGKEALLSLLGEEVYDGLISLTALIDSLYDVDRTWDKGFGSWKYEYKYRRGGKTLCTFYMKENEAKLLVTLGKAERSKAEDMREAFSENFWAVYESTPNLHDGKWLWLPVDQGSNPTEIKTLLGIKRRPNRKE